MATHLGGAEQPLDRDATLNGENTDVNIVLYNILLQINCYISGIPINVIVKTLNDIRTSHGYFIRSLGHCISP